MIFKFLESDFCLELGGGRGCFLLFLLLVIFGEVLFNKVICGKRVLLKIGRKNYFCLW